MKLTALAFTAACLIAASLPTTARAEQLQYYVWTDDNGQVHATDTPPDNRDYETRTIVFEPGTGSGAASGDAARQSAAADENPDSTGEDTGSSPSGRNGPANASPDKRESGLERALTAERAQREEASQGPDPAGHTSPPGGNALDEVPRIPGVPGLPGLQGP